MATDRERRRALRDAYKAASAPRLTRIDYAQLDEMLDYIEGRFADEPCDHTARHAQRWAQSHDLDWIELAAELREFGGFCDCEIVLNVDPEVVFD
ncbi:DUF2695 domain-containing protein [Mycobacterium sp. 1423905.2]|uniref:DUF2695 domain-containing protein n=1 Tax=Mycobacterium sp. 1423905.2 TaxID=1856859 RepID=UPI0008018AC6|nr:DUF2695 domain-containing protein [Mycobacterium sp. 1423905.2]OBJ62336.1 hypothetical protein A9W95_08320 [Mycobacterium sp. 1423905.2]